MKCKDALLMTSSSNKATMKKFESVGSKGLIVPRSFADCRDRDKWLIFFKPADICGHWLRAFEIRMTRASRIGKSKGNIQQQLGDEWSFENVLMKTSALRKKLSFVSSINVRGLRRELIRVFKIGHEKC